MLMIYYINVYVLNYYGEGTQHFPDVERSWAARQSKTIFLSALYCFHTVNVGL